ncbi:MAG TPA: hypothetical protein VMU63_03950 [Acidimicrobiales bacterium]|nr:hypothetical protein [Acidimicrobiales bacterium]
MKKAVERSGSGGVGGWLVVLAMTTMTALARWGDRPLRDEAGNVITDNLAWIVFGVVAIVVIGGLLETLGRSVVSWVSGQLGL